MLKIADGECRFFITIISDLLFRKVIFKTFFVFYYLNAKKISKAKIWIKSALNCISVFLVDQYHAIVFTRLVLLFFWL